MRRILSALLLVGCAVVVSAATVTLPSITVTSPPSTSITYTPAASSYTAPLAVGTPVYHCLVAPATWVGAVSISSTQFTVANLSGASFDVVVGPAALGVGTYAAGSLTSSP